MIVIIAVTCVMLDIIRKMFKMWNKKILRGPHGALSLVERKKKLRMEVLEYRAASSKYAMLALSPIQGTFDSGANVNPAEDPLWAMRMTIQEAFPTNITIVDRRALANLALSEVILRVDIAPSLPPSPHPHRLPNAKTMLLSNFQSSWRNGKDMTSMTPRSCLQSTA